jgi:hypothetical protein
MNLSRRSAAPLGALLALSLLPIAATADAKKPTKANPCGYGAATQTFLKWGDHKRYVLAPNGGFEAADPAWTLADGAAVTEGNEPFLLNAPGDHQSLALPAGTSATSPTTCIAAQQPVFRFVARTSGDKHSRLKVEVLYTGKKGGKRSAVVGKLRAGDEWRPTKKLATRLGRVKTRGKFRTAAVSFRFTPVGPGDWQIDDLYLDPRSRR